VEVERIERLRDLAIIRARMYRIGEACASVRDDGIAGNIKGDTLVNIGRRTTGSTSDVTGVSSPIVILVTACVIARDARRYSRITANRERFAVDCLCASGSTTHQHTSCSCRTMAASWSAEMRLTGAANINAERREWSACDSRPPPIGKPPAPARSSASASAYRAVTRASYLLPLPTPPFDQFASVDA